MSREFVFVQQTIKEEFIFDLVTTLIAYYQAGELSNYFHEVQNHQLYPNG